MTKEEKDKREGSGDRTDRTEGSRDRTDRTEGSGDTTGGTDGFEEPDYKTMHHSKQWTSKRIRKIMQKQSEKWLGIRLNISA